MNGPFPPIVAYDSVEPDSSDILTPACPFCGKEGWITVSRRGVERILAGEPIQEALPSLDPSMREQIRSGTHPECFPSSQ